MWNQSFILGPVPLPKSRDIARNVVSWHDGYHLIVGDPAKITLDLEENHLRKYPEGQRPDVLSQWAGVEPLILTFTDEAEARAHPDFGQYWGEEPEVGYEPTVPAKVSPLQMRQALRAAGLKGQADAYLAVVDEVTRESWEYATEVQRSNPFVAQASTALGMTDAQVDELFILAASQ